MLIYKVENQNDGKCYIGKTVQDFKKYKRSHLYDAKNNIYPNRHFHRALRKYGEKKFEWKIICEGIYSKRYFNELEKYYIYFYDSYKNGYNMTHGGDGFDFGQDNAFCKLSPEKRMETILKGNKKRRKCKHSEKSKRKMSETRMKMYKGRNNPRSKKWILYSPLNTKYIVKDGLLNFCKEFNLSWEMLRKNVNNGLIKQTVKGKRTKKAENTVGWRIKCQ